MFIWIQVYKWGAGFLLGVGKSVAYLICRGRNFLTFFFFFFKIIIYLIIIFFLSACEKVLTTSMANMLGMNYTYKENVYWGIQLCSCCCIDQHKMCLDYYPHPKTIKFIHKTYVTTWLNFKIINLIRT